MDQRTSNRFWSKVDRSGGPDACWPWLAGCDGSGYGTFKLSGRKVGAHRVALMLSGIEIPDGFDACHRCDNRPCCNPTHLFTGTRQENILDCKAKGRRADFSGERHWTRRLSDRLPTGDDHWSRREPEKTSKGERNGQSKLTDDQVRTIRRLHAAGLHSYRELAAQFGVTFGLISHIVTRRSWKHVL